MPHAYLYAAGTAHPPPQFCAKASFGHRREALRAKNNMDKQAGGRAIGRGSLNVYRCACCRGWHIGHLAPTPGKGKR